MVYLILPALTHYQALFGVITSIQNSRGYTRHELDDQPDAFLLSNDNLFIWQHVIHNIDYANQLII